ncbi:MAG: DUF1232 domain-containing protein [Actinobacteria bacterium]|nr:MAG: DUF1232 domain-containing protein [Actinomycetota bacterium]
MRERLRARAGALKRETHAIYLAYRDPRTPWLARGFALAALLYALSPIDLIPDPIPVLGYLDDLLIVPGLIALAVRFMPREVLDDARQRAADPAEEAALGRKGAVLIALTWVLLLAALAAWVWRLIAR